MAEHHMVNLTELVLEALRSNGDIATTTVIYQYVDNNKSRLKSSDGSRHSVQGAVSSLKSTGRIEAIAPATYRRVKNPQPVKAFESKAAPVPSPLDPMYD